MTDTQQRPDPASSGWQAAPSPSDPPPGAAPHPYAAVPPPYGQPSPYAASAWQRGPSTSGPKPPWFWPIVAVAVGLAALLVGGGVGFAVGHAIGEHQSRTSQLPQFGGDGTRGGQGGMNPFGGQGTRGGGNGIGG